MLLKALLPAPGAEHNSYLKNAYKKKSIVFSHLWKIKANKYQQQKKKKANNQQWMKEWKNKKKKKEVKAEVWWSNRAILVLFPFCVANDQNYMRWA